MNVSYVISPHFSFLLRTWCWFYDGVSCLALRSLLCLVEKGGKKKRSAFSFAKDRVFWVLPASENENSYDAGDHSPHHHLHPHLPAIALLFPPFSAHVPVLELGNPRRYPSIHASTRLYPRTTPRFHCHTPGYLLVCVSWSIAFSALGLD